MRDVGRHHISSAVVSVMPDEMEAVLAALALIENVEVFASEKGKIVVVIEGDSTGALGDTLIAISDLKGVISANMVFEHVVSEEENENGQRTFAA